MFKKTLEEKNLIKKVSIVESFFNPLDLPIKKGFKFLWMHHFNQPEPSFYRRLKTPIIEDYALIIYFLDVKNQYSYLLDYYKEQFKDSETKEAYPTYKSI